MPPPKKERPEPKVEVPVGDPSAGRAIFDGQCAACHALEGDNRTASAPTLGGLFGRAAGATAFPYSKSMKAQNFAWTDKHLFAYLKNPSKYVVGTRMAFAGIDSEQERADLIAYLKDN